MTKAGDGGIGPGRAIVWDLQSGQVLASFESKYELSGLSFSPDGRLLAATGSSPDATIWNWADKKVHALLLAARRTSGNEVAFLPKTGRLMINDTSGRLLFYDLVK